MKILVLGGAGYIGTHTCVELIENGHEIVVFDNLSNSKVESLKRVEKITGKKIDFYLGDILNKGDLKLVFSKYNFDAVINFAGLKAVGESAEIPLSYYQNNITGAINVLEIMQEYQVYKFIFSSSATVYGDPKSVPIDETCPLGNPTNPYGRTKLFIEYILQDLQKANPKFNIIILRYFNPIGAHFSGLMGEDPNGIPNNLIPYITQVAIGKREYVNVFGNDYGTIDGTGVRDYIHVVDLAKGHALALEKLKQDIGIEVYNLGTGKGYSVLQVLKAFEDACGRKISYQIIERRKGDIAVSFANCDKAFKELGFKATYDIDDMAKDSWNWQKSNPNGYQE